MWFLPLSYRRRIPRRNNFLGQKCSPYTAGFLNLSCTHSGTCQLRNLDHTSNRARILRSPCTYPMSRWYIVPATNSHTQLDNYQLYTHCNLHRYLLMLHHNQCDRTQTDTLEQPRMAHTLLCLNASSCTCLRCRPRSFRLLCRRIRCGSRQGDSRGRSHRHQERSLHTRFEPDQSGNHSPCMMLPL